MLDRLRVRVEDFLQAAAHDRCRVALEDRPDVGIGARYLRAAELFGQDTVREVQRALAGAAGAEERQLRALLEFLAAGRARSEAASELDRLLVWQSRATFTVRDEDVALREAPARLRAEPDRGLRLELEEARLATVDEQLPLLEGLIAQHRDAVQELGYGDFTTSWEILSGIDLRGMARDGERYLGDTDAAYRELLAWHLPRLTGAEPDQATAADAARLEEAAPYRRHFADARRLRQVQAVLAETGLDPAAGGRLSTATRPRLPGGRGAVCCALRIPDEVVLTVSDAPGRAVHESILQELGVALHRAHTSADLPLELRWLGDAAVPLGMGRTLAALLRNPPFLTRVCSVPRAEVAELVRLGVLLELLRTRRAVGLLQVELAVLEQPDPGEAPQIYVELMQRATGLRHDGRAAPWELRVPFRGARELRADQLAAVADGHLRDRFDEDWWRNPRTGAVLLDWFGAGQRYTASELAVQLASRPMGMASVRERLEEAL